MYLYYIQPGLILDIPKKYHGKQCHGYVQGMNVMVLWHFAAYCGTNQICPAFKYRGCQSNEREDEAGNI